MITTKFIILCLLGITAISIIFTSVGAIVLYFLFEAIFNSLHKKYGKFVEERIYTNPSLFRFLKINSKRNPNKIIKINTKDRGEVWYIDLP